MTSGNAWGLGIERAASPRSRVTGLRDVVLAAVESDDVRWWVRTADDDVFGIAGLRRSQLSLGRSFGALRVALSAVGLRSPLGGEQHAGVTAAYGNGAAVYVDVAGWVLALDGAWRSKLATVSAGAAMPLSARVSVVAMVDGVRVAGVRRGGADTAVAVVLRGNGVSAVVGVALDRHGESRAWIASQVALGSLDGAVGYDDGTSSLHASIGLNVASIRLSVGASAHAVLGLSKRIQLAWSR